MFFVRRHTRRQCMKGEIEESQANSNDSSGESMSDRLDEAQSLDQPESDEWNNEQNRPRRVRRRMSAEHIRRIKRRRRNKRILIGVLIVLLMIAAFIGAFVWSAWNAKGELERAVEAARGLQSTIAQDDASKMGDQVSEFSKHVDNAYRQTASPLWTVAVHMPYVGEDIGAVRTAVAALENISSQALPQLVKAAKSIDIDDIQVENGTIGISGLEKLQEPLQIADDIVDDAAREINATHSRHFRQIEKALKTAGTYCSKLKDVTHTLHAVVQLVPGMLGTDGHAKDVPRNYLILAQTNAEARPSGGLTGALGLVTVQGGHLSLQSFISDTQMQLFDEPVVELTAEEKMLFTDKLGTDIRDVNFTPDFPRTGEIAKTMWSKRFGTEVDGVIAIDPLFLQNMLAVTGGMTMSDGVVLDGTNTAQELLNTVYARMDASQTDAYFAAAAQAAFSQVTQGDGDAKAYVKALATSAEQGHLLVWSAHEDEQDVIDDFAISGRLVTEGAKPQVGVYVSDETQSKMDWYLHREVSVKFQKVARNGARQYTVHIKLQNLMKPEEVSSAPDYVTGGVDVDGLQPGDIKNALFLYAPANGRLVDWKFQNQDDFKGVTVHDGLTVGVGDVTLHPGETYEITLHVQSDPDTSEPLTVRQTPLIEGR